MTTRPPNDPSERYDGPAPRPPHIVPADCRVPRDVEPSEREQCRGRIMARAADISALTNRLTALKIEQVRDEKILARLRGEHDGR